MDLKDNENEANQNENQQNEEIKAEEIQNEEAQNESENQLHDNKSSDLHNTSQIELNEEIPINKMPKKTSPILFAVIGVVIVLALGAVVFGKSIMKTISPKNYFASVIVNSKKNFAPKSLLTVPAEGRNLDKPIEQNLTLSIDDFTSDYMDSETEEVLDYAKMGSFSVSTIYDKVGRKNLNTFSLKTAGMEIASLNLFFSDDVYALKFPLGYENYLTIDPNTFVTDFNESVYASLAGPLPENMDLNSFTEALFNDYANATNMELFSQDALSKSGMDFYNTGTLKYAGKENYEDTSAEKYTLTFTAENTKKYYDTIVNSFIKYIVEDNKATMAAMGEYEEAIGQIEEAKTLLNELTVTSDLVVDVFVGKKDRIMGIKVNVTVDDLGESNQVESEIKLLGEDYLSNNMEATLSFLDEGTPVKFNYKRDASNTDKAIDESNTFSFTSEDTDSSPVSLNYKLKYNTEQIADNFDFDVNMTGDNYGEEMNINFNILGNYTSTGEAASLTDGKLSFEITEASGKLKFDYNTKTLDSASFELGESKSFFELSMQELMQIGQNIQNVYSYFE